MKKWCWLSFLLPFTCLAQVDTIVVRQTKNYFPHIASYQQGEIPCFLLCDSSGIQTYNESKVLSFDIAYWNGHEMEQISVDGKQIPDSVCAQVGLYSLGQMLFITKIKTQLQADQEIVYLHAMNLIPILKEDD